MCLRHMERSIIFKYKVLLRCKKTILFAVNLDKSNSTPEHLTAFTAHQINQRTIFSILPKGSSINEVTPIFQFLDLTLPPLVIPVSS